MLHIAYHTQVVLVYLVISMQFLLLKYASRPNIAKKSF